MLHFVKFEVIIYQMGKFNLTSDSELISIYQNRKDAEIIGELYKRYKHVVLGISLKYLNDRSRAEDAVMEVFEELIKSLESANIRDFKPWIGTVTRNHLHRKHKVEARSSFISFEDIYSENEKNFMEFSEDGTLNTEKTEIELREKALINALDELKDDQKLCIKLFFLENCSYSEVCQRTGYSFKKVKSFIQNGKRNLKNILSSG